jgi:hypothetical protein
MTPMSRPTRPIRFLAPSLALALTVLVAGCGRPADQEPATSESEGPVLDASGYVAVGEQAPDFALRGATRYGVLAEPVRLSDYQGKTVVLAFFFRARGRG